MKDEGMVVAFGLIASIAASYGLYGVALWFSFLAVWVISTIHNE